MERLFNAFSRYPLELGGIVLVVIVSMLIPIPIRKRYSWDRVRLLLSPSQRFKYAMIVHGSVMFIALVIYMNLPIVVAGVMPLVKSEWALYTLALATVPIVYIRRIQEVWTLNWVCDQAFSDR